MNFNMKKNNFNSYYQFFLKIIFATAGLAALSAVFIYTNFAFAQNQNLPEGVTQAQIEGALFDLRNA